METRTKKNIVRGIELDVVVVNSIDDVPNAKLYYVNDLGQFCIKVNEMVLRGNIGNIYGRNENIVYVNKCMYGKDCNRGFDCPFYHDPIDVPWSNNIRNFTYNSWLYQSRGIGNRQTLLFDINNITKDMKEIIYAQTMHDVLLSLVMEKYASRYRDTT